MTDMTHDQIRQRFAQERANGKRARDAAQAAELDARVIHLMRGLLAAMMRQSAKVERFKHTQHPLDALHAKYSTRSGEPVVGDAEWGHLQLDATAIFLLMLVQMSAGGLQIVRSRDELMFVQNLVWYLAHAWRTPDYGIWERGNKRGLRTQAAQAAAQAAQDDVEDTQVQQLQATLAAYYALLAAQERLRETRAIEDGLLALERSAAQRVRAGDLSAQDGARTRIEAERARGV